MKIRLLILFLCYGNKYKRSIDSLMRILEPLNFDKRLIIIRNDIKTETVKKIDDWIFQIGGDNSTYEFSGWQKGIESKIAESFEPQVYLFVNDTFITNSCYALPILNDEIVQLIYENNLFGGHKSEVPFNDLYKGDNLSSYIQTHFFIISANIVNQLPTIVGENNSNKFIKQSYSNDFFTKNEIWNGSFKRFMYIFLTRRWHGRGKKLSEETYNFYKRKTISIINELLLSAKITTLNYRIVDLTPFPKMCNSYFLFDIPCLKTFRQFRPFQFIRKWIFIFFKVIFSNNLSRIIGLDNFYRHKCFLSVKKEILEVATTDHK